MQEIFTVKIGRWEANDLGIKPRTNFGNCNGESKREQGFKFKPGILIEVHPGERCDGCAVRTVCESHRSQH